MPTVVLPPAAVPPPAGPPLRILLVEIRDGGDLDALADEDDLYHQNGIGAAHPPKSWSTLSQLIAPLEGMWNAGHVSVTRRNRRELCLLESAYSSRLHIRHVIFTIEKDGDETPPLSWHLTSRQRDYIAKWADSDRTKNNVESALRWVRKVKQPGYTDNLSDVCRTAEDDNTPVP